jgi:hypothetical protein
MTVIVQNHHRAGFCGLVRPAHVLAQIH